MATLLKLAESIEMADKKEDSKKLNELINDVQKAKLEGPIQAILNYSGANINQDTLAKLFDE